MLRKPTLPPTERDVYSRSYPEPLLPSWPVALRALIAQPRAETLETARAAAVRVPGVLALLRDLPPDDPRDFQLQANRLAEQFAQQGDQEAAGSVQLLALLWFAVRVETFREAPFEEQLAVLHSGLEACDVGAALAGSLQDRACQALFMAVRAGGLQSCGDRPAARAAYVEALGLYRDLAAGQPQVYRADVASTLNNLGNVLRDLRDLGAARAAYGEALQEAEVTEDWLMAARIEGHLAGLEGGSAEAALEHARRAVQRSEQGLRSLSSVQHADAVKHHLEPCYLRLIAHHARRDEARELVAHLEAVRRVEALAGAGVGDALGAGDASHWEDLRAGCGPLSERLRREKAALLWTHALPEGFLFAWQMPGTALRVELAPPEFAPAFGRMFAEIGIVFAAVSAAARRPPQDDAPKHAQQDDRRALLAPVVQAAEAATALLPEPVREVLFGTDPTTLFLAPCGRSMLLPWEFLRLPGAPGDAGWLGLRRGLPRVHSLAELAVVVERQPPAGSQRQALVVGDPAHVSEHTVDGVRVKTPAPELPVTRAFARYLAQSLPGAGLGVVGGEALVGTAATSGALQIGLRTPDLALWCHSGHGGRPTEHEGAEYLCLAGEARFHPWEMRSFPLPGTVVHHDCCVAGTIRARGGGRFDGHPTAALAAGASAVLSSVHPLWDAPAGEFSVHFYHGLLHPRPADHLPTDLNQARAETVAEALLRTRRAMAAAHDGDPLIWATTVLWGNPWAVLGR